MHSAAVYGDLFFLFVVNDRKTSAPVFIREHVDPHVSPAAVQLHLCRSGQGKASGFISGPGVRQVDLFIAELFELGERLLDQAPAPDSQFSGEGQAPRPVLVIRGIGYIRKPHPGDEDRLVSVLQVVGAGCRIGIKAEVEHMEGAVRREGQGLPVHGSENVSIVVLTSAAAGKGQVLRAQEKDIMPADVLDRRALPHIPEGFEAGNLELSREGPAMLEVLGGIDQDTAAFIQSLRPDDHEIFVLSGDTGDLGISLVFRVAGVGPEQGQRVFFRPAVIAQAGQAGIGVARPVGVAVVAGVIKIDLVAYGHGRPGVDTLVVIAVLLIGKQADAQVFPGHQVFGDDVVPVLEPVHGAPGTPLVEQMPPVVMPDKTVGIVHQAGHRLNMEMLAIDGFRDPSIQFLQLLRILQITVFFFLRPFPHPFSSLRRTIQDALCGFPETVSAAFPESSESVFMSLFLKLFPHYYIMCGQKVKQRNPVLF